MTPFQKAFAAARKAQGAGGEFEHEGKKFNTNYAEENEPKMEVAPEAAPEVDPMSQMLQDQFKNKSLEENLAQGKGKIYGQDNDKTSKEDMTYSDAKQTLDAKPEEESSLNKNKLAKGLGKMFGGGGAVDSAKLNSFDTKSKDVMGARRAALMKMIGG